MMENLVEIHRHSAASAVVILAPHGGRVIPAEHRDAFLISPEALEVEQDLMIDHHTDLLARALVERTGASAVINTLSRFVVDVERFPDEREEMNQVGMGVLYTHGSQRQPIRNMERTHQGALLEFFHDYSAAITNLVGEVLDRHDHALILDLHSFPLSPLPYELHHDERRPQLCLGHEEPHVPSVFMQQLRHELADWDITDNEPFHGSYVPLQFLGSNPRVTSVMLEIRRDTYLTEPAGEPLPGRLEVLEDAIVRALDRLLSVSPIHDTQGD
jgi:N-formylglutamate amidohydrolase